MSRSRRKTPIFGNTTAETDHPWKKQVARRLRHRVKQVLEQTLDGDHFAGRPWDLDSAWSSEKDGKHYCAAPDPRWMRK
ncbi:MULTISPECIES: hypothetical protein [unclassified Novosphingobium]|uniref:hypothetical protein n=1 Tax=unclassified Novosphingobium TaxID=2644732 RepID=UPI000ED53F55|nr:MULTISPECIES: hypothetical protein [unclassified Novosphingobium]HCF24323.1 hypothetical protein [Novosphingobium sp.]HQV03841.1 hypothetical protein [Novosphingobium sp.]